MRTESQLFVGSVFLDEDDFSLPSGVCIFQVMAVVLKKASRQEKFSEKKKTLKTKRMCFVLIKG